MSKMWNRRFKAKESLEDGWPPRQSWKTNAVENWAFRMPERQCFDFQSQETLEKRIYPNCRSHRLNRFNSPWVLVWRTGVAEHTIPCVGSGNWQHVYPARRAMRRSNTSFCTNITHRRPHNYSRRNS